MQKKLHVVINRQSGTVLRLGEQQVENTVRETFGDAIASLIMVDSTDIAATLSQWRKNEDASVVVGGGDGTAVCAAEHLGKHGIPFAILPLGTMNLLARDLGAAPTFEDTMKMFKVFHNDHVDLADVNGRLFLCSAVIGVVPESAVAREEIRDETTALLPSLMKFLLTVTRGMSGADRRELHLSIGDGDHPVRLETTSLIVSNNRFVMNAENAGQSFLRETLKDGKLAVYSAAPSDMMEGLRLMFRMVQGTWQNDEAIFSFETPSMTVNAPEKSILVSLDGEPVEMSFPLKFSVQEKVLPVLRMELMA